MMKDQLTLADRLSLGRLLSVAKKYRVENAVKLTTDMAMRPELSYSHLYASSANKFLSRHDSEFKENPEFAKTLLLAGFGAPYKHGVQFRGMMSALNRGTPVEVLQQFSYDDTVRAELILNYRELALPSTNPYNSEHSLKDCSVAINHPILRLKASGHYISQFAGLLNQPEVKSVRAQSANKTLVDLALIAFATEFTKYEMVTDRQMDKCQLYDSLHGFNSQHIAKVFAQSAPYIADSATLKDADVIHAVIFKEGRKAKHIEYYCDAVSTFVTKAAPKEISRPWLVKPAA